MSKHPIDVARPHLYSTWRRREHHLLSCDDFPILVDFYKRFGIIGDGQPQQQALGLNWQ